MADPILQQNPVTINFVDTSPAVSQPVPVTAANPLPVTIAAGGADADINVAAVGGTATVTGGVSGLLAVGGNVAHDAVSTGNPVLVGGVASSAGPTPVAVGDRVQLWTGTSGQPMAGLIGSASGVGGDAANQGALISGSSAAAVTPIGVAGYIFNGTNWDRQRGPASAVGSSYVENGPYTATRVTGDGQIKATAGFIHTVSIAPTTATPTAGLLTVYNSASESGTIVYSEWIFATTPGHTITLDVACSTGIYVGFDGTLANVSCTVAFR